jgi:hypothetical protein
MTHGCKWIASCFIYHWIWFECECITMDQLQNNTVESVLRVLQRIIYKTIPLNRCWMYYNGSITKQYLLNLCIYLMAYECEWIASCFTCYRAWFKKEGITMDQLQNNTFRICVSLSMTCACKRMGYEVSHRIDSVLIPHTPSIYNLLRVTHRSFASLLTHLHRKNIAQ